jgi:hypothetical protein
MAVARPSRGSPRLVVLAHPAFTGAVAVLAVNDHVLKARLPGWWTGKLSDLAGVFLVAAVLSVLTGRPRAACVATAVGFASIKLWPQAAVLAAPLLGGMTRQDPTDLVALVMVWPGYRFAVRVARLPPEPSAARSVLGVTVGMVLLLSVTATSCAGLPSVEGFVIDANGRLYTTWGAGGAVRAVSEDGGRSWREVAGPPSGPPSGAQQMLARQACAGDRCFRVVDGVRVEERSGDGPWQPSFAFTGEQRRRLALRTGECNGRPAVPVDLRAVAVVPAADGLHVVVAAGQQGVLHRQPSGVWERRAVLSSEPLPLHGPRWLNALKVVPLVVWLLVPLVIAWRGRRSGRRWWVLAVSIVLVMLVTGYVFSMAWTFIEGFSTIDYTLAGPVLAGLAVVVFLVTLAATPRLGDPPRASTRQPDRR